VKLTQVIEELVEEKGLDRNVLSEIISEGMLAAYKKKYPDAQLEVSYNKKTDEIEVLSRKKVVTAVADDDNEIGLRKARSIKADAAIDDIIVVPFDKPIGRLEVFKAKQIIGQKIRSVEARAVYEEFKSKEGTVIYGVIHKCEHGGAVVKVNDTFAFLPKSLMIPGDKCIAGYSIRALLKEVLPEPRNESQLILDRSSNDFLKRLFELEIPEVFEKLVEIKKVVRAPGYKSKVAVLSHDPNIDPVGTCVGVGGSRIKPILRELGMEKIDVIRYSDISEEFVKDSLKPAVVKRVELVGATDAHVWVDEGERSVAIGKMGQNISLASRLTGFNIQLIKDEPSSSASANDEIFHDNEHE
jgi:transcription termination/antitermination protein NusA